MGFVPIRKNGEDYEVLMISEVGFKVIKLD